MSTETHIIRNAVPSHFGGMTIIIHQTLSTYGVDADAVFEKSGITYSNLNTPESRISGQQYASLLKESIRASGDENFIFTTAKFIQPSCFNALGFALFSSRTIRKFLERFERYWSFISTADGIEFVDNAEGPHLIVQQRRNTSDDYINMMFSVGSLIWINRMIELMHGPKFRPTLIKTVDIEMSPAFKNGLEEYFDCPIDYNTNKYALHFHPEDMEHPLPTANAGLAQQNDEVILGILARMAKADVPMRVRHKLLELLPTGEYSKATVAKALGFSVRAFHNKLSEGGTSYQDLLDETRLKLATQYLRQERYNVGDVAFLLGFSDFSNFSRAFKKWTEQTPTEFRAQFIQ